MTVKITIDGELTELNTAHTVLQALLKNRSAQERQGKASQLLDQFSRAIGQAREVKSLAAQVEELKPLVEQARQTIQPPKVAELIAYLATGYAIEDWEELGGGGPLPRMNSDWIRKARDEVAANLSIGLFGDLGTNVLGTSVYKLLESNPNSGREFWRKNVRHAWHSYAYASAFRTFNLEVTDDDTAFEQHLYKLALDPTNRSVPLLVDIISRGGKTTGDLLTRYVEKYKAAPSPKSPPKVLIIRILLPKDAHLTMPEVSRIEDMLEGHNVYLWVRQHSDDSPVHGNLVRTLDAESIAPALWWTGRRRSPTGSDTIRDLHVAMRRSSSECKPIYLYLPCPILGEGAKTLGRQIADDFDEMWANDNQGTPPRFSLSRK